MLPAGAVGDRIPKRVVLLTTQTAMMVLAFALAFLAATERLQVWHIGLLALCLGIANSFDAPARHAMVAEMVDDRRDLYNAVALNSTLFNVSRIVGPAIGGVILAYLGAAVCFTLNGLSFWPSLSPCGRCISLPFVLRNVRNRSLNRRWPGCATSAVGRLCDRSFC